MPLILSSNQSRNDRAVLGDHSPAITIVIADIFDEAWLLEIDVIACA